MKQVGMLCAVGLLFGGTLFGGDFMIQVRLGKHKTDNPNGVWVLEKKHATQKQLYAPIISKEQCSVYPCLEYIGQKGVMSDIKIIDTKGFKEDFLGKTYYHFFWRKRKNKGYSDPNAETINATISPIPQVIFRLKNSSGKPLKLLYIQSRSIYQQGGMADSGKHRVKPAVSQGVMEIAYNRTDRMTFPLGYRFASKKSVELLLSLWVKDAAHGDGTGALAYLLELYYQKDGETKHEVLARLLQGDGEGYDETAGGIVPVN